MRRPLIVLGLTAVPFVVGRAAAGVGAARGPAGNEVTRFEDQAIVESSGLVVVDGLLVTTNDSGDSGRVFSVDPATGQTVGVTAWSAEPDDVEALAPAGGGEVWVGDIGDNRAERPSVSVSRVPAGRGRRRRRHAVLRAGLPRRPARRRVVARRPRAPAASTSISKGVLGGLLYAAPERLSAGKPNRLEEIGPVLGIATDAAFFPDGRHIIVRNYTQAAVYSWPELDEVGRFGLPDQQQGEGIAVADDGTIYASSEGLHAPVLRIALPAAVRRAMEPAATATLTRHPDAHPERDAAAGHPPGQ